jgi:peptidoglycan/LPS O-acetylase OafA/YrhL
VTIAAALIALGVAVLSQAAGIGVEATIGIPLAIAATLVLILAAVAGVLPALSWGPLVGLGVISYGVYIWGSPIFGYGWPLVTALPGPLQPVVLFVLTVAISVFSYRFLELPVRSRVRSRVEGRARRKALEADIERGAMGTGVASGAPPDIT